MRLTFRYRRTGALSLADRDALFEVYSRSVEVERAAFDDAVTAADHVIEYRDRRHGVLRGMGLVSVIDAEHEGRPARVIWTGSVLIESAYRGQAAIETAAMAYLARELVRHPGARHFWFFDTFSYKSYLLMARNFEEFWPRPDRAMPEGDRALLEQLARARYGARWDPERGLAASAGKRLKDGVAPMPRGSTDPWIEYFARANPTAADGTVLVCLCPLHRRNLARLAQRWAERALAPRRPRRAVVARTDERTTAQV